MRQIPSFMLRHRVTVEPLLGSNADGEAFGQPVEVRCMFNTSAKTVVNAQGEEVTRSASYITTPDHDPPQDSRVTTPDGNTLRVVAVDRHTWPGMPVPANTEVHLGG